MLQAFRCATSKSGTYATAAQTVLRECAGDLGKADVDCLVAVEHGTIIGAVIYIPRDGRGFGYIKSIGVARAKQSHGIGEDLKRQVLDNCSRAGVKRVASEVHRNNGKMRRVNEKLGITAILDPEDGKFYFYAAELVPLEEEDEDDGGAS